VGEECPVILPTNGDFHAKCRDFLHDANLRHRTEGRHAENFFAVKNPTASNPRTWVPEASGLTPRPPKPLALALTVT
jgi:hypothetical protein